MLIYIRHSDDEVSDPTFIYDPKITYNGKKLAYKEGYRLIKKYGIPDIIYCSPLRRTKLTLKYMLYSLDDEVKENIKIYNDTNASRYFPKKEKNKHEVSPNTLKSIIPLYETYDQFTERVKAHSQYLEKYINSDKVVWCITHTTFYKKLCKLYSIELPSRIPFMHNIIIHKSIYDQTEDSKVEDIINTQVICKKCNKYH